MPRGRPRQFPNKEYVNISFRKRKDDYLDVLEIKSRYDENLGNNRAYSCKKLGVVPKSYTDWEKEIIRVGTPEMEEFTKKARMRRWEGKSQKEISEPIDPTTSQILDKNQETLVIYPMRIVLMVILMAGMTGITSAHDIEKFWTTYRTTFKEIFPVFPKADITQDIIRRVAQIIGRSDSEEFIYNLITPLITEGKQKQPNSFDQAFFTPEIEKSTLGLPNVYAAANGTVLSQCFFESEENTIKKSFHSILSLALNGCIITTEAMSINKRWTRVLILTKIVTTVLP